MTSPQQIVVCDKCGFSAAFASHPQFLSLLSQTPCPRCNQGRLRPSGETITPEVPDTEHSVIVKSDDDLGNVTFISNDHIRYQDGRAVTGHNRCQRAIQIRRNSDHFLVTIYNLDGNHPISNDRIQMAPKQMKILKRGSGSIEMRGFGYDQMGTPFESYGIMLHISPDDEITQVDLLMHDRGVVITYTE
ncbi:MAG TPA: hypothetical protein PKE26_16590 [Kiritimatiellia bacterium]|nr:hypothetical protein [Saprospiraceae bacterium]HMP00715.1 hypothetical protein [Kiritimatiellia bacterium]